MIDPAGQPLPQEQIDRCLSRQRRLRRALEQQRLDGLLIAQEKDIFYLTGFIGHDSLLLVWSDGAAIISDPRYDELLDPWKASGSPARIIMGVRHRLEQSVAELCRSHGIDRLGLQAEYATLAQRRKVADALPDLNLAETEGMVTALRMRKDESEIAAIEQAVRIQQGALAAALEQNPIGMREEQFAALLEYEMRQRGASGASFETTIATGANSSIIHHQTGRTIIQPGVFLVDWGAVCGGYCSDITRTFAIGLMPKDMADLYQIVLDAQLAAIDAAAPGRTCAEIDDVARRIITDAGYGGNFGHGLGHGLGLEIHEPPYFNNLQTDVVLEPGMVMTVEPGIYLPGVGGVRIEDDVLITERGSRVLTDWPKQPGDIILAPGAPRDRDFGARADVEVPAVAGIRPPDGERP